MRRTGFALETAWGLGLVVLLLLAAGCRADAQQRSAEATLKDRAGKVVGTVALRETSAGVLVHARFEALPPGVHAFHVHETGSCEPPFDSAGGHFCPEGRGHGFESPDGPHAGDLPNLHVPDSGKLELEILAPRLGLSEGPRSLFDADGSAFVVHEGADDYESDPAGAAGGRIACGVIRAK